MIRHLTVSLICLLIWAGPASADFCVDVHNAQRLEAQLQAGPADPAGLLAVLAETATSMRSYHLPNASMQDAINDYVRNVIAIRDSSASTKPSDKIAAHATGRHRVLLRYLSAFTLDYCAGTEPPPASTVSFESSETESSSIRQLSISWETTLPVVAMLGSFAGIAAAMMLLILNRQRRKLQGVRHDCSALVSFKVDQTQLQATAINVSALGLKIKMPKTGSLPKHLDITIDTRTAHAHVIWQNAHYAGLKVSPPLPLSFVRRLSEGRSDRQAPSLGSRRASKRSADSATTATAQAQTATQP